jgi:hypothetical protein
VPGRAWAAMSSPASDPVNRRPVAWRRLTRENTASPKSGRFHNGVLVCPPLPGCSRVESRFGNPVGTFCVSPRSYAPSGHPGVIRTTGSDRSCQPARACARHRTTAQPPRPQCPRDGGTGGGRPSRGRRLPVCSLAATSGSSDTRVPTCSDHELSPACNVHQISE